MRTHATLTVLCLGTGFVAPAAGQSINPTDKYAWGENIGFMNWADASGGGVTVNSTFLSGFIWCENVGWINTGDGSPGGGGAYVNADGSDFGVNIDGSGDLFGYAWGENVGWINFDTRTALTPFNQQARLDSGAGRFRGYAWGENIGWINLDDATHFVGLACLADWNGDGFVNTADFVAYLNDYVSVSGGGPFVFGDPDLAPPMGAINTADFIAFLNAFSAGCP